MSDDQNTPERSRMDIHRFESTGRNFWDVTMKGDFSAVWQMVMSAEWTCSSVIFSSTCSWIVSQVFAYSNSSCQDGSPAPAQAVALACTSDLSKSNANKSNLWWPWCQSGAWWRRCKYRCQWWYVVVSWQATSRKQDCSATGLGVMQESRLNCSWGQDLFSGWKIKEKRLETQAIGIIHPFRSENNQNNVFWVLCTCFER